ncbi:flagellar cap protein FliD N-terminal domain-containing protein [Denitromonas sp.]|uniref:flagellar cap protein FliD N-terminal domain-containing protein n=1 Tax=Denitromonas sp. TaxID=2734609 RepID=UPI002AFDEA22|nr:flagellar cap protein FliD N-terminal domain-containing protein [Denitromonas sp.]
MATGTISSLGIGSGLDSNSIVTKLMEIERRPLTVLNQKESSFSAKISALGTIKSKLTDLQTAAKTLGDPNKLAAFAATVGDSDVLSASAGTFAKNGSYAVERRATGQGAKIVLVDSGGRHQLWRRHPELHHQWQHAGCHPGQWRQQPAGRGQCDQRRRH